MDGYTGNNCETGMIDVGFKSQLRSHQLFLYMSLYGRYTGRNCETGMIGHRFKSLLRSDQLFLYMRLYGFKQINAHPK